MYLSAHPPQTVADLARLEPFGPFNKKNSVCSTWSLQLEATVIRQKVQHAKKKPWPAPWPHFFARFRENLVQTKHLSAVNSQNCPIRGMEEKHYIKHKRKVQNEIKLIFCNRCIDSFKSHVFPLCTCFLLLFILALHFPKR